MAPMDCTRAMKMAVVCALQGIHAHKLKKINTEIKRIKYIMQITTSMHQREEKQKSYFCT
jgi:hypothetical protein